jgi:hypothetical protein
VPSDRGDRLGGTRKGSVGLEVDADHAASQEVKQLREDRAAHTAHAVEHHGESTRPDPFDVDDGQAQNGLNVSFDRPAIRRESTVPRSSCSLPRTLGVEVIDQREQALSRCAIQEHAVGSHELERIPLDRVVTGCHDDPTAGPVVFDRELCRRCWDQPTVDDIDSLVLERVAHGCSE